jgi:hypothetical protein
LEVSFQFKIALKRRDVHWIEGELLRLREEMFLEVLKRILKEIEEEALRERKQCERYGAGLIRYGREERKIRTLVGSAKVLRVRLHCQGCGQDSYPLDEAIGLEGGDGTTIGVRERALWAAVEVSYEKAAEFLKKFTGLEASRQKVYEMALEEGRRIGCWEERRREQVFGEGESVEGRLERVPKVLYIQVDGTGSNDRSSGEWMECKVGASFSRRVQVSKGRVWLMDKRTYASIEKAESFGEKFYLDCMRQGVMDAEKVYFISDGAVWIRKLKEDYFLEALGVLDIWHLEREFKRVLEAEREDAVESLKGLALRGEGKEIVRRLVEESSKARDVEEAQKIMETIQYVMNNLDWIENIPKVEGYGSVRVEKTVDIAVSRRFKKRGISWYRKCANPLLKLRLLKLNGDWQTYWNERQEQLA